MIGDHALPEYAGVISTGGGGSDFMDRSGDIAGVTPPGHEPGGVPNYRQYLQGCQSSSPDR
ncbi:hypothetical protein Ari01nite_31560 [Paractinoplanes rishiriensis]|uniref:Uncharacterized protein n=1 Tax=Paractinoplanes rishiriensis TaxID=1050105 RepID=A0A919MQ23_9ACTN|nr:hypothetical protein Ari01nite_31560 [Actinoplanes rishiriensis]